MPFLVIAVAAGIPFAMMNHPRQPLPPGAQDRSAAAAIDAGSTPAPPADETDVMHSWPQWRGPLKTGVAPHADPPIHWSEDDNLRWKIELPGKGHSTPIVWGDRVFVTTAVPAGDALPPRYSGRPGGHDENPITHRVRFIVIAVDRGDGTILWQRTVREDLPHEGGHVTSSLASASPVTDGRHVFASFGSYGLYCLDFDGELKWQVDLGRLHTLHGHGEGSSPALHGNRLILNWDHEGSSFVAAFDTRTGDLLWKTGRDVNSSWTTPVVVDHDGRTQVIVSGSRYVRAYDLATGAMIWECRGLSTENVVSSPVAGNGMVYAGSTYDQRTLLAIRLDGAQGDITGTGQVVWTRRRGASYVPSPLLYADSLYFIAHFSSILTRADARTGSDQPGAMRLAGLYDVFSSPIAAAGRVYVTDRAGSTVVLTHDDDPQVLAVNRLEDAFSASAAAVGRELFLRGERYLYCIAAAKPPSATEDR